MAQMTKEFAESLLKRVQDGRHINTTCWEEEQLIRGWLYWHEHVYEPRMKAMAALVSALRLDQPQAAHAP
jgi:hypothetical protein